MSKNLYFTQEIWLAAYLVAIGHHPPSVQVIDQTTVFCFKPSRELFKDIKSYRSRKASVDALTYNGAYRLLAAHVSVYLPEAEEGGGDDE